MRIAVLQLPGTPISAWQSTLQEVERRIDEASVAGAKLTVLPECIWPTYALNSVAEFRAARRAGLPSHEQFLERMCALARRHGMYLCAGYIEEHDTHLSNAACLIDDDGRICGVHRKCFLWDFDNDLFAPGDQLRPIETKLGPIGIMICADARLPELPAALVAQGARLIVQPTAWVDCGDGRERWNAQADFLIAGRARELGVPIISASKWGGEMQTAFVGCSLICAADGAKLRQCGPDETAVCVADVEIPEQASALPADVLTALSEERPRNAARADVPDLTLLLLAEGTRKAEAAVHVRAVSALEAPVLAVTPQTAPEAAAVTVEPAGESALVVQPMPQPIDVDGIRIMAVDAAAALHFPPLRRFAVDGVHLVVVFDRADTLPLELVQTRACENRIFVLHAGRRQWRLIDVTGRVQSSGDWPAPGEPPPLQQVSVPVLAAADKEVAPRSNVLRGWRSELAAGVASRASR